MRARVEEPEDGRWMTVDPLWPALPRYSYGSCSPALYGDPSGLQTIIPACLIDFRDQGLVAGGRAKGAGEARAGPRDCKMFVNECYAGIAPMPPNQPGDWTLASDYDNWFRQHPGSWREVPNNGNRQPGDVIVIDRPGQKHGHVQIVGSNGEVYDAAYSEHGDGRLPGPAGDRPKGRPVPVRRGEVVTIWRPGGLSSNDLIGWRPR